MDTLDRVMLLIKRNYPSDKAFEDALGIKNKTVYEWKRKRSESYLKMIPEISKLFNVTADYLLGRSRDPRPFDEKKEASSISDEDAIRLYNKLVEVGRINPEQPLTDEDIDNISDEITLAVAIRELNIRD